MLVFVISSVVSAQAAAYGSSMTLLGSMLTILGFQVLSFGILAKTYSLAERFDQDDKLVNLFYRHLNLEKGLLLAIGFTVFGLVSIIYMISSLLLPIRSPIPREPLMIFSLTTDVLGAQTMFTAFFGSLLSVKRSWQAATVGRSASNEQSRLPTAVADC